MLESNQKRLGIYYTPGWLAKHLVTWAFLDGLGPILDPSFGGCSLLRAALEQLTLRVGSSGSSQVYGFDIDRGAQRYAEDLVSLGVPRTNLIFQDFLSSDPQHKQFKAVVGNPPYIRHQRMSDQSIDLAQVAMRRAGVRISKLASAWAYFVVHSAEHLINNGRMVLLLPGAVLHADYARPIIQYLRSRFKSVQFIHVRDRLFPDAQEETIVLLAEGFGGECARERHSMGASIDTLVAILNGKGPDQTCADGDGKWKSHLLSRRANDLISKIRERLAIQTLSDVADIRIGVVTGANSFFVRGAKDDILSLSYVSSIPIVSRGGLLSYPTWRSSDQQRNQRGSGKSRLLTIAGRVPVRSNIHKVIHEAELRGIHENGWCKKREPWYVLPDRNRPDIFFPYMGSQSSPMTLNKTTATCTNAIHRIWSHLPMVREAIVVSSWTTFYQLVCEIEGRSYGGGILKVEPSAAKRLPVFNVQEGDLEALDHIARTRGSEIARKYADRVTLRESLGLSETDVGTLREAVTLLSERRRNLILVPG